MALTQSLTFAVYSRLGFGRRLSRTSLGSPSLPFPLPASLGADRRTVLEHQEKLGSLAT